MVRVRRSVCGLLLGMLVHIQIDLSFHFCSHSVSIDWDGFFLSSSSFVFFVLVIIALYLLCKVGLYRELLARSVSRLSGPIAFMAVAWVSSCSRWSFGCVLELLELGLTFGLAAASLAGHRLLWRHDIDIDIEFHISSPNVGVMMPVRLFLGLGLFLLNLHIFIWA